MHVPIRSSRIRPQAALVSPLARDGTISYAILRVLELSGDRQITFEWRYPFAGQVTGH